MGKVNGIEDHEGIAAELKQGPPCKDAFLQVFGCGTMQSQLDTNATSSLIMFD